MSVSGGFFTVMSSKSNLFTDRIQYSLACFVSSYHLKHFFQDNTSPFAPSKWLNDKSILFLFPGADRYQ